MAEQEAQQEARQEAVIATEAQDTGSVQVEVIEGGDHVILQFDRSVQWVRMDAESAASIAGRILEWLDGQPAAVHCHDHGQGKA